MRPRVQKRKGRTLTLVRDPGGAARRSSPRPRAQARPAPGDAPRGLLARLAALATRLGLWRCAAVGRDVEVHGRVWIHGGGHVVLGDRVVFDGGAVGVELHAEPGGVIVIGDDVVLEAGAAVEAGRLVIIGAGCHLGPFSRVMDNQFHHVEGDRRLRPPSRPVRLDEGVVLGERAVVLPGAHLGAGVHLAADTVVGRKVRAGLHLAGVPPRVEGLAP